MDATKHMNAMTMLWSQAKDQLTDADGNVVIPHGMTVILDEDTAPLATLAIHGTLKPSALADVALTADNVLVFGALEAGTEDAPHLRDFKILLTGDASDPDIVLADWVSDHSAMGHAMGHGMHGDMGGGMGHDHMGHMTDPIDNKALIVAPGGKIDLHGAEKTSWTVLDETAEIGANSIEVVDASGWQVGDLLAIAPTDVDAFEVEERTIVSIDGGTITLDQPLEYLHTGYDMTLDNGRVLELRAEVSNLSRNIVIEGSDESDTRVLGTDANDPRHVATAGYGGHTIYMNDTEVRISGVEFTALGISGELGRYPVHFHHSGDMEGSYIKDNAIHHVFQRGVVVHQTDNALIEANTVYDTLGHGIYIEDGVETGNRFAENLVMMPRSTPDEVELGDINNTNHRASGFWITNPSNEFEGNHVAAVPAGMGFWFQPPDHSPESAGLTRNDPRRDEPLLLFEDNVAHSIDFDRGIGKNLSYANGWTGVALDLGTSKRVLSGKTDDHAPIESFTAWKIGNIAIAMDGAPEPATILNPLLAEARVMIESDGFGGHVAIQDATVVADIPDDAPRPDWPSQHPGPLLIHAQKDIEFVGLQVYGGDGLLSPNKSSHSTDQVILTVNADGEGLIDLYSLNQWLEPSEGSVDATIDGQGGNDLIGGDNGDNILIGGIGDDTVGGHGGDDILVGGLGDDELSTSTGRGRASGSNDDVFFGGLGDDTINVENTKGNQNNTIIYRDGDGSDAIFDFKGGADKIVLVDIEESDLDQNGDGRFDDTDLDALSTVTRDGRFVTQEVQVGDDTSLTFTGVARKFTLSADDFDFLADADAATGDVAVALGFATTGGATDDNSMEESPSAGSDPFASDPPSRTPADPTPVAAPGPLAGVMLIDAPITLADRDTIVIDHDGVFATDEGSFNLRFRPEDADQKQTLFSKDSRGFDDGGHLEVTIQNGEVVVRAQTTTTSLTLTGGDVSADSLNDVTLSWANDTLTVILNGDDVGVIDGWTNGLAQNAEPIVLGASQSRSGDGEANKLRDFFTGEISEASFAGSLVDVVSELDHVGPMADDAYSSETDFDAPAPVLSVSDTTVTDGEGVIGVAHDDSMSLAEGTFALSFVSTLEDKRDGIFSKDARGDGDGGHLSVYVEQDGDLVARFQGKGSEIELVAQGAATSNTEHDLVFTFGDAGAMLYLDGILVASDDGFTQGLGTNSEHLQIGALGWGSRAGGEGYKDSLDGTVMDFRLYNQQIAEQQIDELFV